MLRTLGPLRRQMSDEIFHFQRQHNFLKTDSSTEFHWSDWDKCNQEAEWWDGYEHGPWSQSGSNPAALNLLPV